MIMDRISDSPTGIPPGFSGNMQTSVASGMTPVVIPHGNDLKAIAAPHYVCKQSPPISASAPTETVSCVNMLFHSSSERRSLSPHRKMAGTLHDRPVLERVRVLSCSDLESALTAKLYEGSKLYQEYQSPAPAVHLPPIQACSSPQYVQHQVHRMTGCHNLQPLIFEHPLAGQQTVRMGPTLVRPPPGFEVPLLNNLPSPLTAQYASPQPWSPSRLAPVFYRNENFEQKEVGCVELRVDTEIKTGPFRFHTREPLDGGTDHQQFRSTKKRQTKPQIRDFEHSPSPGTSLKLDGSTNISEREMECNRSVEKKMSNEESPRKKKEKKKKSKNEKRKCNSVTDDKPSENTNVLPTATSSNNKKTVCETELDETDNCELENGKFQPLLAENAREASIDLEKEKEKLKKLKKKFKKQKKVEKFEHYLSLEEVISGLADKTLIEAEIRINQKNYKEAYISVPEDGQDVIIVGLKDRNRSLEGDIVVVKLHDEADWPKQKKGKAQRSGKVVFIKERVHHRCTVGILHMIDKGMILLVPRDQRFPLLRIRPQSIPLNLLENLSSTNIENILFKATLISWNITRYAYGIIKKKVGKKGELESETAAIFEELGLDREPVPDSSRYLPPLPYQIPEEEISSRLDFRSEVIFTIDPPTARDLDDAVSIKKLNDEVFQVGVHISDVSYFLQEGTQLDKIVSQRATTVYMVEEVYHMLPISLCGLCSLNPGEDKLTISVIMTVDKNGCVLDKEFRRSVIHSCAQLTYDQVQDVIDGKDFELPDIHNNVQYSDIKDAILQLHELASHFRKKRFDCGALKIDQPKLWFTLDADCMPNSLAVYEIKDSHRLIEEFMLLANETVARFIYDRAPDIALLRRHDPPKQEMIMRLEKSLKDIGIYLDSSSAGNLHTSLSKYCDDDEMKAHVLYHLCARPMKRAVYFCSSPETHHYALNMEKYTHFTSPIRRYADIIVHRILTACLDLSPIPPWDTHQISRFASVCNRKKYSAKRASEMSCDLFRTLYIKKVGSITADAIVVSVSSHALSVIVPSLAYNTRISLEKRNDIQFEFVDQDMNSIMKIKWPEIEEIQELKIFSCVQVLLMCGLSKTLTPHIQTVLLPPPSCPS